MVDLLNSWKLFGTQNIIPHDEDLLPLPSGQVDIFCFLLLLCCCYNCSDCSEVAPICPSQESLYLSPVYIFPAKGSKIAKFKFIFWKIITMMWVLAQRSSLKDAELPLHWFLFPSVSYSLFVLFWNMLMYMEEDKCIISLCCRCTAVAILRYRVFCTITVNLGTGVGWVQSSFCWTKWQIYFYFSSKEFLIGQS